MKRYFVAYRFSGESLEILEERLALVVDGLREVGVEAYSNFFDHHEDDQQNLTKRQIMDKAFERIGQSDGLFVLVASNDKSEGQLMEVGYAYAKGKPIVAAVQEDASTYIDSMADKVIRWKDLQNLKQKLKGLEV